MSNNEDDLYHGHGPWGFNIQNIFDLTNHTNLHLPNVNNNIDVNDEDVVQMPFHVSSNKELNLQVKDHWTLVKESLSQRITTSTELEEAIKKYNDSVQKFAALHYFLNEFSDTEQRDHFFNYTLPGITKLALRLPKLLQRNVPILKQKTASSVSLSQLQVASLLANAFLCTFPTKPSLCPGINFNRLFSSHLRVTRIKCVSEKLKTLCHYFDRIISKEPKGVLTFERKHFTDTDLPTWENITNNLGKTKVLVRSSGLIEDDADGCLQVDFANKNVGGGVLAYGCVQEEIRFVICPELLVSRLFTEQVGPTEALIITGAERYSSYNGYGDSYKWTQNYIDHTPRDSYGRLQTTIVALDATKFLRPAEQYKVTYLLRELNKAYAGFYSTFQEQLPPVATGNWGCGAYRGDPKLKFLIQLMACNISKRDMVYFTFNNKELSLKLTEMYAFLKKNNVTIAQLWEYLNFFSQTKLKPDYLYKFIYHIHVNKESYTAEELSKFCVKNFQQTNNKRHRKNNLINEDRNEGSIEDLSLLFIS